MISKEIHLKYKLSQHVSEYDFNIVDVELPEIELGEFLVKNLYCSTDPFMRSNMSFEGGFFRMEPNAPLYGESIGIVEESKCSDYPVGTYVWHNKGWREYGICKDTTAVLKVQPDLDNLDESLIRFATAFSLVGRTSYYSMTNVCNIQQGDVLGIDGATGGVGHLAVQIAISKGAKVYGITSTDEKVSKINELGGIGIKVLPNWPLQKKLKAYNDIGEKFDYYHANVGNDYTLAGLQNLAYGGTLVLCGAMKHYNDATHGPGPNLGAVIYNDATIRGCNFSAKNTTFGNEWNQELQSFFNKTKIKCLSTLTHGLESMPAQFVGHFKGFEGNIGKRLCKI